MAKTVIGLMDNPSQAEDVVRELLQNGFGRADIGLISRDVRSEGETVFKGSLMRARANAEEDQRAESYASAHEQCYAADAEHDRCIAEAQARYGYRSMCSSRTMTVQRSNSDGTR
jgi:hypothetical protein